MAVHAAAVLGIPPPPSLVNELVRRGEGNPFFTEELLAAGDATTLPATVQGMKKYLGSGLVKGVGPVMAGRIVDAFGEATFGDERGRRRGRQRTRRRGRQRAG